MEGNNISKFMYYFIKIMILNMYVKIFFYWKDKKLSYTQGHLIFGHYSDNFVGFLYLKPKNFTHFLQDNSYSGWIICNDIEIIL